MSIQLRYFIFFLFNAIWMPHSGNGEGSDHVRDTNGKDLDLGSRHSPGIVLLYSKSHKPDKRQTLRTEDRILNDPPKRPETNKHGSVKPKCARDQPFCLFDEEYPKDKVNEILNTYHDDTHGMYYGLNQYSLNEFIRHDNYTHGYRHKGHFVCESEVSYVRPGWAKNWKNEWVTVVNTDKYPQSMRIETCKYEGMRCEYLPPCYKSFCIQRYTFVKLLCVDPYNMHHRPVVDVFEVPSACSCFVENFVYY